MHVSKNRLVIYIFFLFFIQFWWNYYNLIIISQPIFIQVNFFTSDLMYVSTYYYLIPYSYYIITLIHISFATKNIKNDFQFISYKKWNYLSKIKALSKSWIYKYIHIIENSQLLLWKFHKYIILQLIYHALMLSTLLKGKFLGEGAFLLLITSILNIKRKLQLSI